MYHDSKVKGAACCGVEGSWLAERGCIDSVDLIVAVRSSPESCPFEID